MKRIRFSFELYDMVRVDHFRGFDQYYAIPFGETTAIHGAWEDGPGIAIFEKVKEVFGKVNIIAEDLGFLTPSVLKLLEDTGFPGMKVLEFAFQAGEESSYLPYLYKQNCVVYTGTHDNDTIQGWFASADPVDTEWAREYFRLTKEEGYHWGMMRALWGSVADTAIVQAQDLLGLGSEARMNEPSTVGRNWQWRALPGVFTEELAQKIHRMMVLYERVN